MAFDDARERTEAATVKRRQEAREKGQVARSQEVGSACLLLGGAFFFYLFGGHLLTDLVGLMRFHLGESIGGELTPSRVHRFILDTTFRTGMVLAPFMAVVVLVTYFSNVAQVGFLKNPTVLAFNWERLNPATGLRNLLSPGRMLGEMIKSPLKFALVGYLVYRTLADHSSDFPLLVDMEPIQTMAWMGNVCFQMGIRVGLAFAALAALDYGYQRWQFEKKLRMTREEVKEEMRQTEGDPAIKGRIKRLQRQAAMHRMMADVPKADVVVINPIHFAVAMRYDSTSMEAPRVVAKGANRVAERIVEVAKAHGVPIVEDAPLARALYKAVSIGEQIPVHAYKAVAEILAYVYQMAGKRMAAR